MQRMGWMALIGLVGCLSVSAGCSSSTTTDMAATADMATAKPDLAAAAGDMAMSVADLTVPADLAGGLTCYKIVTCAQGCAVADAGCDPAKDCVAKGLPASVMKFDALLACARTVCQTASGDAGAACSGPMDSSDTCNGCLAGAATNKACSAELTACITDL